VIPVPESAAVAEVVVPLYFHFFDPLLLGVVALTARTPPSVPLVGGAKVRFTDTFCPGDSVYGRLSPLVA
jgi:hypothetical protein